MTKYIFIIFLFLFSIYAIAEDQAKIQKEEIFQKEKPKGPPFFSHVFTKDYSYVANAENELPRNLGTDSFAVVNANFDYTYNYQINKKFSAQLGMGINFFHFSNVSPNVPIPDHLYGLYLKLGFSWKINDQWGIRFAVFPGFYSDFEDSSRNDFNAPLFMGVSYTANSNLVFFIGTRINLVSQLPVIPAFGVRWKFAEKWTLNMLGNPRIEYQLNKNTQIYGGLNIVSGTFRVEEDFGTKKGGFNELDDTWLSYFELRAGTGLNIRFLYFIQLQTEMGYMITRNLEFEDEEKLDSKEGAFYAKINFNLSF